MIADELMKPFGRPVGDKPLGRPGSVPTERVVEIEELVINTCDIVNRRNRSIFWISVVTQVAVEFGISTANLLRAHGGCLGVKSRRAWKSAKCLGELTNKQ